MNTPNEKVIALEGRLRHCSNVITLGVRPNLADYSPEERELIGRSEKVFYPTSFYADLFDAIGKRTFPSYHTYKCVQDKIKQTALFDLLGLPHPRTRVFYGSRQMDAILDHFSFPFVAKIPRGSALGRGVFLIANADQLSSYRRMTHIAYVQEYLPIDRDMRVIIIGDTIALAYWRIASQGEFRCNVAAGAAISLDPVPKAALDLALCAARACRWDDVGMDICYCRGAYYILEANMKYGKQGFVVAGLDYNRIMENLIANGDI